MTSPGLRWEVTAAPTAELGERPVWEASSGRLIWVDINAGQLHELDPDGSDRVIASAGVPVGAAAPRTAGGYVLAAADGFRLIGADGLAGPTVRPAGMPLNVRFNDGACDPAGRFWAGTAATDGRAGAGSLYRLDPDGSVTGFDLAAGTLGGERDLIQFAPGDGIADGLVVDAEGCLWIAMYGGGCVRRYSAAGELLGSYPVPVSRPTCPAFGGPDLDELFLTTAWEGLDSERRAAEPLAGRLLRARPGVRGLAMAGYGG